MLENTIEKNKLDKFLPLVLGILFALVLIYILLINPVVGISDSGGLYSSQVYTNNLYFLEANEDVQFSGYFVNDYGVSEYYNEYDKPNITSANIFIAFSKSLNRLFPGNKEVLDIRFLSVLYILYAAMAIVLFYYYIIKSSFIVESSKTVSAIIMTVAIGLMICDTEYSLFFNSFNTLPVIILSAINSFIWLLFILDTDFNKIIAAIAFLINITILVFCERVYGMVGIIFALMLGVMYLIDRKRNVYNIFLTLTAYVLVVSILSIAFASNVVTKVDKYHSVTRGILKTTDNPEDVLLNYGEDPNYSILSGNLYFEDFAVVEPQDESVVYMYDDIKMADIAGYYFSHPAAFAVLMRESFANMYDIILDKTGNYRYQDNHNPNTEYKGFSLVSSIKSYAAPKTLGAIIVMFGVIITFTIRKPKILTMLMFLLSASVLPIVVGIIRSGNLNVNSYSPLYNIVFDFMCLMIGYIIIEHIAEYIEKVKSDAK